VDVQVGTGHGHHYQRWRATLLPITAPLTLFVAAPDLLPSVGQAGMLYSLLCAAVGSAVIYTTYPSSNVPRKSLKGRVLQHKRLCRELLTLPVSVPLAVQHVLSAAARHSPLTTA
jgi:hypothetical protein